MPLTTAFFYLFLVVLVVAPFPFIQSYWREAHERGWSWIDEDSRTMYVDAAKTLITASGIAVALVASSAVSFERATNEIVKFSTKTAVVCLIAAVCLSVLLILLLLRFSEIAASRYLDDERKAGRQVTVQQGKLNDSELLLILTSAWAALSFFLVGFAFLGRIVFHI